MRRIAPALLALFVTAAVAPRAGAAASPTHATIAASSGCSADPADAERTGAQAPIVAEPCAPAPLAPALAAEPRPGEPTNAPPSPPAERLDPPPRRTS